MPKTAHQNHRMKNGVKFLLLHILLSTSLFSFSQSGVLEAKKKVDQVEKFNEVMRLIRSYYTDTVNEEKLVEDAIIKVLEDLDPHSSYVKAKDIKRSEEQLVGNFEGIGITFQILKDTIMVLEVIPSGPSEKVGLMAGDKIVNDTIIAGVKIDNEGVIKKLRGPKNTKVRVSMLRKGEKNLVDFTITRDRIPIHSVTAAYMVQPGVGYIRIERFSANTIQEFGVALLTLQSKGMKDLIFDLQGNTGGYLVTAIDLCNQLLGENKLIVYTQGEHSAYQPYFSNNNGVFKEGKVVVMIDEGSASASEIFSGCVQDNDRGLLVGRRTFGKGLVQKPFPLLDGSQVKLTTAHYYTPSGRNIQKPYSGNNKDYREDYKERIESGELFGKDTFKFNDSLLYHTTNGRNVYGGGGVMPDYFVPIDTSMNSPLFNQLVRKGVENKFCLEYVDKNRKELHDKYTEADSFFYNFEVDTNLLAEYITMGVSDSVIILKDGMNPKTFWQYFGAVKNDTVINFERDIAKSEKLIKARLKASIGRNLFDAAMSHRVINATVNNVFAKAVEIMNSNKFNILLPKAKDGEEGNLKGDSGESGKAEKKKKKVNVFTKNKDK
jgi:carboxyl-terminal processing protease